MDVNETPYQAESLPEEFYKKYAEFWTTVEQEAIKGMLDDYSETSKQLISISGVLQGLYFTAISFSSLKTALLNHFSIEQVYRIMDNWAVSNSTINNLYNFWQPTYLIIPTINHVIDIIYFSKILYESRVIILFMSPIIFWLLSLSLAVCALMPKQKDTTIHDPDHIENEWCEKCKKSMHDLAWAQRYLLLGFVSLTIAIVYFLTLF